MKEYIITWFIENYSYCWHKNGECIISPEFTANGLEDTIWSLQLFPRGGIKIFRKKTEKGQISFFLARSRQDKGPENFQLNYKLSVLAADRSILKCREYKYTFGNYTRSGYPGFLEMEEVLLRRKADYLPEDTLTLECRIWTGEGDIQQIERIVARTLIGIEHISFSLLTKNFSKVTPYEVRTFSIKLSSNEEYRLKCTMYFTDDVWNEEKIIVGITSSNANEILSRCKISLLDKSGELIQCGEADNRCDAVRKDIIKLPLTFTRQVILNRKNEYLPDDQLTLLWECIFSTGVEYKSIEATLREIPFAAFKRINDYNQDKDVFDVAEKLSPCPSALDDLEVLYSDELLTDVQLKTKTKSFPAHKTLLCARSTVFKDMLTKDMKEKNTNCIQVDNLEDNIVEQLLLFLYSDKVENLQWESAIQLYYVGDKYMLEKLKIICAAFLVKNLSSTTASELLLLADTHNDSDLKRAVEYFIFNHEEQVYGSKEWSNLRKKNPVLVSETMCLKYEKKIVSLTEF